MKGAYDIQTWLREYSNDSIDFSTTGIAIECLDFVEDLERYIQSATNIEQEIKAELNKDFEQLRYKLNQLIKSIT